MGLDHLAVLSQEYPGFEASISGMLGSPFLSAHGLSNHTLSSNNMSSAGLSGHGRLSAHGMSAHGMSAHGLSAFDISRMFGGQNEPLGGQQAEHLGAALQSEKAVDANQSKRKKRSGAWVYKDGAETAAGGGRGAKAPAHTQRKPGPPSSRDKVWDLLEEHVRTPPLLHCGFATSLSPPARDVLCPCTVWRVSCALLLTPRVPCLIVTAAPGVHSGPDGLHPNSCGQRSFLRNASGHLLTECTLLLCTRAASNVHTGFLMRTHGR